MLFNVDENLPVEVATVLRNAGQEAKTVSEQNLSGWGDKSLIALRKSENPVLVTLDSDFSNIRAYPPQEHNGIIVLKLRNQGKKNIVHIFRVALSVIDLEAVSGYLWIIEEDAIRVRGPEKKE